MKRIGYARLGALLTVLAVATTQQAFAGTIELLTRESFGRNDVWAGQRDFAAVTPNAGEIQD